VNNLPPALPNLFNIYTLSTFKCKLKNKEQGSCGGPTWLEGSMDRAVLVRVFRWRKVDVTRPSGSSCFLNPARK
jgi:hypothetical protein